MCCLKEWDVPLRCDKNRRHMLWGAFFVIVRIDLWPLYSCFYFFPCRPPASRNISSVWFSAGSQWYQELIWKRSVFFAVELNSFTEQCHHCSNWVFYLKSVNCWLTSLFHLRQWPFDRRWEQSWHQLRGRCSQTLLPRSGKPSLPQREIQRFAGLYQ